MAARRAWHAIEFVDNDISASRFSEKRRPAFSAMMDQIRSGAIRKIVCWHTDRLYRQPRELEDLIDLAEHGGVEVVSVASGALDLNHGDGRLHARVMVAVNAQESDQKSERIRRAKRQAREQGKFGGGRRAFGWRDGMTPEPREAALINVGADDLLAGGSMAELARQWTRQDVPRPQSGRADWVAETVYQVMTNARHAGLIAHRERLPSKPGERSRWTKPTVMGEAAWPVIIDRDRWERLQATILARGDGLRMPRKRTLLTGMLRCGLCGATMVRTGARASSHAPTQHAWRCPSYAGCSRLSIRASDTEDLIVSTVLTRFDRTGLGRFLNGHSEDADAELVVMLRGIERDLDALSASYAAGRTPIALFERTAAALETRRDQVSRRLRASYSSALLEEFSVPGALRERWPNLSEGQRRAVLARILDHVVIEPGQRGLPRFDPQRVKIRWAR